jgi:hypothetical protein
MVRTLAPSVTIRRSRRHPSKPWLAAVSVGDPHKPGYVSDYGYFQSRQDAELWSAAEVSRQALLTIAKRERAAA